MCQCDDNYSKKHFCIYKCTLVRVSEMFTIQITFLKMFLQNFGKTSYVLHCEINGLQGVDRKQNFGINYFLKNMNFI